MIPIAKLIISDNEINEVISVLQSGHLVQGKKVSALEEKFKKLCKTDFAVATNSGTSALHTALYSIGIQPGDEIITTPFSFIATANAIIMAGAKPVFVDINDKTYNIDPNLIESAITKKTKAILCVNLYGQPSNYELINKIARKYKLIVIEDAAQSINAQYNKKNSGNLADIACFSLYATKNITSGEGGMITTNSTKFADRSKRFRQHGQTDLGNYEYNELGYNYRMTDIHASIALAQFNRLSYITNKRRAIARKYSKAYKEIKGLVVPFIEEDTQSVFHQYTLRVTSEFKLTRDEFKKYMESKGIQTAIFYPKPLYKYLHIQKYYDKNIKLPKVEKVAKEVISIPVHASLSIIDVNHIINTIKKI